MNPATALNAPPKRAIFEDDREDCRESFRSVLAAEAAPNFKEWDASGVVARELFT